MAYLIGRNEVAADALRRILREQNRRARALLTDWEADPADRIHRTRQTCKKIRAALRLVRPASRYVFEVENRFYRDLQRQISYARDAAAMVEALDLLAAQLKEPRLLESVHLLRDSLAQRAADTVLATRSGLAVAVVAACDELRRADGRLERLPLNGLRRRDLRRGAIRTLRHGARWFGEAVSDARPEIFHAWRKQVKYAYYQSRLLVQVEPERAAVLGPPLRDLADVLGRHQDLVLLDGLLRQQPDTLGVDTHLQRLRQIVARQQGMLRAEALEFGSRLFRAAGGVTGAGNAPAPGESGPSLSLRLG